MDTPKWFNKPAGWRKPATLIDGYKADHRSQYPDGTEVILSNFTARSTRRIGVDHVCFAGLQYFLKEYLISLWNVEFFLRPFEDVKVEFKRRLDHYLPGNRIGYKHIKQLHELGYIPLTILALPEGSTHKLKIPSVVFWNNHKDFFWVTNYIETIFSTTVWGICTSSTTAAYYKRLLNRFALETVGNTDFVGWQGHDFSFRGMFGLEAAGMSGAGHLFNFFGTDTIPAIDFLEFYYQADCEKELIGGSVPATEHSVACSTILDFVNKVRIELTAAGKEIINDELMNLADIEYIKHLITEVYPTGIVSIVADSFDYWNTITNTARVLKDVIMNRDGKVVFRPDTGDPVKVVIGEALQVTDTEYDTIEAANKRGFEYVRIGERIYNISCKLGIEPVEATPQLKGSIECLWDIFGGTTTDRGYKLLDSHVGLIYGDSITLERAEQICTGLKNKGFASINIVFGIGSFTYQYNTRDTDGFAVKATYAIINGEPCEIYKAPKGAEFKKSAKGLTAVFQDANGEFYLKDQATWEEVNNCALVKVFENGNLLKDYTLQEVRANFAKFTNVF